MAEAHDPLARRELAAHPGVDPVRGADRVEGVQGPARRAAVQRTGERADGADEAGGQSAPVEAITRAVKVEALKPWSTVATRYCSMARACSGGGSAPVSMCR